MSQLPTQIRKSYAVYFVTTPGDPIGPYASSVEAEEILEIHGDEGGVTGVEVQHATFDICRIVEDQDYLEIDPEDEDPGISFDLQDMRCFFTGKPPAFALKVRGENLPFFVCEEVARDIYEALGKMLGTKA